jgi:hypothetical protein
MILPISEQILQTLHNLCATASDLARKSEELAQFLKLDIIELEKILKVHAEEGYSKSFTDFEGKKWHYLTPKGIIKVCGIFT